MKVYLIAEGKRSKKKKTAVRKSSRNPVWNEALTFNIAASNLSKAAIEVSGEINENYFLVYLLVAGDKQC